MRAAYLVSILTVVLISLPGMAEEGDGEGEATRSPAGAIELPVIDMPNAMNPMLADQKRPS